MTKIELPSDDLDQVEKQLLESGEFILSQTGDIIHYPYIFFQAWVNRKLKVFTHRQEDGKIDGLHIVSMFTCPVTGLYHRITGFKGGVDISEFVEKTLAIYEEPEQ